MHHIPRPSFPGTPRSPARSTSGRGGGGASPALGRAPLSPEPRRRSVSSAEPSGSGARSVLPRALCGCLPWALRAPSVRAAQGHSLLPSAPPPPLRLPGPALTSRPARSGGGGLGRPGLRPPRAVAASEWPLPPCPRPGPAPPCGALRWGPRGSLPPLPVQSLPGAQNLAHPCTQPRAVETRPGGSVWITEGRSQEPQGKGSRVPRSRVRSQGEESGISAFIWPQLGADAPFEPQGFSIGGEDL